MNEAAAQFKYLPELADGAAGEEVDAIYAEIKRLWGIDSPALFFRTLATTPNGLNSCWNVIEPYAATGRLQVAARCLSAVVDAGLASGGFQASAALVPLLSEEERAHVVNAIGSYNRANPMNLMAVATLVVHGARRTALCHVPTVENWSPEETLVLSTTMLDPARIGTHALEAIARLSEVCEDASSAPAQAELMPSLYRHLARFPQFLIFAADVLHEGANRRLLAELIDSIRKEAVYKARSTVSDAVLHGARVPFTDEVEQLIQRFLRKIPEMVVIGRFLSGLVVNR